MKWRSDISITRNSDKLWNSINGHYFVETSNPNISANRNSMFIIHILLYFLHRDLSKNSICYKQELHMDDIENSIEESAPTQPILEIIFSTTICLSLNLSYLTDKYLRNRLFYIYICPKLCGFTEIWGTLCDETPSARPGIGSEHHSGRQQDTNLLLSRVFEYLF